MENSGALILNLQVCLHLRASFGLYPFTRYRYLTSCYKIYYIIVILTVIHFIEVY